MNNKDKHSTLVYSTETGRIKPTNTAPTIPAGDGIVRLRLETKGRNGKGVTTVSGLLLNESELKELAKKLKQKCSCGGSIKDGVIEIQGDHRTLIKATLEQIGHTVKLAGG